MLNPKSLGPKRRSARSLLPLLILVVAGALWVWGAGEKREVDQALALSVDQAARAVCDRTAIPDAFQWPLLSLKSTFVETIRGYCGHIENEPASLTTHIIRGDMTGDDGPGTHLATIMIDGAPILELRLHAESAETITVLGWSRP